MAAVARYLADTSALARLHRPPVSAVLAPLIESGVVGTCGVIEFELGWAARSRHYDGDYDLIAQVTGQLMQWVVPRGTVP